MKDLTWLRTLFLSGMALGVEKFAEIAQGEHDLERLAVAGGAVAFTTVAHYLVHRASEQHSEAERELRTQRNHLVRRGMLGALRRALPLVAKPSDPLYERLAKNWDDSLDKALNDDQLERFFPAELFAESHWQITNAYSPTAEQNAAALAAFLREWLTTDLDLFQSWSQDHALDFARRALPLYQLAFADDLIKEGGALYQAFTVKGVNEIRAFTVMALPLLQQLVQEQRTGFAEIVKALRELGERQRKLDLIMPQPVRTKTMQPSQWLQAHNAFVPMVGRDSDIDEFLAQIRGSGVFRWQVCFGEGGMGKTRMATELARRAISEGWYAGFITAGRLRTFVEADTLSAWRPSLPTFIVVDYAASKTAHLRRLFEHFAALEMEAPEEPDRPPTGLPIRVLLLERHGDNGRGWLRELLAAGEGTVGDYLRNVCYLGIRELQPPGGSSGASHNPIETTRQIVASTFASWAERTKRQAPFLPTFSDREWRSVQARTGNRPLYLQMAAIHACETGSAAGLPTWGRGELLRAAVARERDYVTKECPDPDLRQAVEHTAAMLCLTGAGASQGHRWPQVVQQELRAIGITTVSPNTLEQNRRVIFEPPRWSVSEGEVGLIQPDIVSEGFAASVLRDEHDPPVETLRQVLNVAGIKAWSNLVRMVQDLTGLDGFASIDSWLPPLLDGRPLEELRQLVQLLPERSATLHEFGLRVGEQVLDHIPKAAARERAECLLALANHRFRSRDHSVDEQRVAEEEAREAGEILRAMARTDSDVSLRILCSRSDHILSMTLANQKRAEQAAVAAFNAAATAAGRDPTQRFESMPTVDEINALPIPDNVDLAFAMGYGMNDLTISGVDAAYKLASGRRAVEAGEQLVSLSWKRFASDCARFNHNYSNVLWAAGQKEDAIEACRRAIEIAEDCARDNPDEHAYSFALTLSSLAGFEYGIGNRDKASEICERLIAVFTELSSRNPGLYRARLAQNYHNIGYLASDADKATSLKYTLEGLKIRQELVELDFDAHALALAWSYHNAACDLEDTDGPRAYQYFENSYRLRAQWAERHPGVHVAEISKVANLLAKLCGKLKDKEGEVRWLNAAVDSIAKDGDESAESLNELAVALGQLGETERAGVAAHGSANAWRPRHAADESADNACNFASALALAGDFRADETELQEAIDVSSAALQRIEGTPTRKEFVWGALMNNLGHAQFRLGQLRGDLALVEKGIEALTQSISHHESQQNPSAMAETQELLDRARGALARMNGKTGSDSAAHV